MVLVKSLLRPGLDPGTVYVRILTNKMSLAQFLLRVPQLSPVNIFPPMLNIHLRLYVTVTGSTKALSEGTLRNAMLHRRSSSIG